MFLRLCTRAPRTTMFSLSAGLCGSNAFSDTAIFRTWTALHRKPDSSACKESHARQEGLSTKAEFSIVIGFAFAERQQTEGRFLSPHIEYQSRPTPSFESGIAACRL